MTQTLVVSRTLPHPIDRVFDEISDHEGLAKVVGVRTAQVTRPGTEEKNGSGAIRRVQTWALVSFEEEITAFERPHLMGYQIIASRPPLDHDGGEIRLTEVDGGTHVEWTTRFRVPVPVVGGVAGPVVGFALRTAFTTILRTIDQRLSRAGQ